MTESETEDLNTDKIPSETYMVPGLQGKLVISRMSDSQHMKQAEKGQRKDREKTEEKREKQGNVEKNREKQRKTGRPGAWKNQ